MVLPLLLSLPLASVVELPMHSTDGFPLGELESRVTQTWRMPSSLSLDNTNQPPPTDLEDAGATELLSLETGADTQDIKCECDKTKCNCMRRCACDTGNGATDLSASGSTGGSTGGGMASLLQLQEALAPENAADAWEGVFLQTGSPMTLDCQCEKIKCNCMKGCQCSMTGAATYQYAQQYGGAAALLQEDEEGWPAAPAAGAAAAPRMHVHVQPSGESR